MKILMIQQPCRVNAATVSFTMEKVGFIALGKFFHKHYILNALQYFIINIVHFTGKGSIENTKAMDEKTSEDDDKGYSTCSYRKLAISTVCVLILLAGGSSFAVFLTYGTQI